MDDDSTRPVHPHRAIAIVESCHSDELDAATMRFEGTAVRFRSPFFYVTCAHLVEDFVDKPQRLSLGRLGTLTGPDGSKITKITSRSSNIEEVLLHPTADLAILRRGISSVDGIVPFTNVKESVVTSDQIRLAGFTYDLMGDPAEGLEVAMTSSEGMIKQTSLSAKPFNTPYCYAGGVFNDQVERGLSGAAVYDWWFGQQLLGIATGEQGSNGVKSGWMLQLGPYREWLEENVSCAHGHDDWDLYPDGFSCSSPNHS